MEDEGVAEEEGAVFLRKGGDEFGELMDVGAVAVEGGGEVAGVEFEAQKKEGEAGEDLEFLPESGDGGRGHFC